MNKEEENRFKKQVSNKKALSCIFCSYPLFKSGTINIPSDGEVKVTVCKKCSVPKTEKDMELMLKWEKETGNKVYAKHVDWKGIREHFIKYKILDYVEKNPGYDSEDIAKALFISDKLASDLTTELARDGKITSRS